MKPRRRRKWLFLLACTLCLAIPFFLWQNNGLVTTSIALQSTRLPESFNGFRIAHISDLHNKRFGEDQKDLVRAVQQAEPDLIVITGDLIDKRRTDIATAMEFIHQAVKIAPVCYVPGNHEAQSGRYGDLLPQLSLAGVTVLNDASFHIEQEGDSICILGIRDPSFWSQDSAVSEPLFRKTLDRLSHDSRGMYTILLSHRPELLDLYAFQKIDLVFSGHAHGGQIRLPLIGALFAPDQGLFPRYTSGLYTEQSTSLIVSRGLGNSLFPLRLFNRPELVLVTLQTA